MMLNPEFGYLLYYLLITWSSKGADNLRRFREILRKFDQNRCEKRLLVIDKQIQKTIAAVCRI